MIFYYWKILVVAAEQGLLDEKLTKAAAVLHLASLLSLVQTERRYREARFLLYFKVNIMGDTCRALAELQHFLQDLDDPAMATEKALTLADIVELQLRSESQDVLTEAEKNFRQASELFSVTKHAFGNIDLDFTRLSVDRTISAGERFIATTKIADRYFEVHQYQNGIRCLAFAISPEMIIDAYHDAVVNALELLDNKIKESGSELLKQVSLLHSVCQACLKATEYGFALRPLESYLANPPEEIGPTYHSSLALILVTVYSGFGEFNKALQAAEQGLEIAKSGCSYSDQSIAAFQIALQKFSLARQSPQGSAKAVSLVTSALDLMKEWVDKDVVNGYTDGEVQKCLLIGGLENWRAMQFPQDVPELVEQPWIERVKKQIPDLGDVLARASVVDLEMRALIRQGRYSESLALSADYLDQLSRASGVSPMQNAQAFVNAAVQAQLCVRNTFQGGQTVTPEITQSAVKLLWSACALSYNALQLYRRMNGAELILDCTVLVWDILNWVTSTTTETRRHELLTAFVEELNQTERVCDDMRRSVLPIGGLQPLMDKRLLVSKKASLKLYNVGVNRALSLEDPAGAWMWLQKGKARAFADSLGAKLLIPRRLLDQINNDHIACELLKKEQSTLDLLHEPDVNHVIAARRLTSVRSEMEGNPLLAEARRLRDELFNLELGTDELREALPKTGLTLERVKFVDWYVPSLANPSDKRILLFVRQLDGTTRSRELAIDIAEVRAWVDKMFNNPEMSSPPLSRKTGNRSLKAMNGLLEGLSDTTSEEDLLILSPSGLLNGVPLHALDVDGRPLIQRNFVVYTSSVGTFGQCLLRASSSRRQEPAGQSNRKYFAVYEEPTNIGERTEIFAHINTLGSRLRGDVSLGHKVTKSHFLRECASANWIHYHGHARYSRDNVLKSSLVLSNGTDLFSQGTDDDSGDLPDLVDELEVSELFEATLPQGGVHFTIIACDSGTQDIAPGDEPLGIIPALLNAGATSVLGCLWPINSRAGRAFSEVFYAEVARSSGSSGEDLSGVIHLASAMRATVLKMKSGELGADFKQAYYWAPFALHGLWYL